MIPQETIEQIRQATDIVQVIGEFVRLKKRGRNYLALCPFHTEKTPSFSISPDKQIYHCFGCGKGGSAITFLMEHENMSFVEAVRYLARKANITIVEDRASDYKRDLLDRLHFANQTALTYFHKQLKESATTPKLMNYLRDQRGIRNDAIDYFQLGFASEAWDGFLNFARSKDLKPEELEQAGLVLKSETKGNYFDRFRLRLMIPILNLSGKAIAFGGRTLKRGEQAKYVNSPETILYNKSNVLYGLNYARDAIRETGSVYIVEGYFDVISLWQVGIKNVVASSGTAFTPQQARLLARFAEEVYLFFDADSAGRNAALRSVDSLYDAGLEVKIIVPPEGEDPDSLAREYGRDKIEELQHDAVGFIPYRIKDFDLESAGIISREKLIKEFGAIGGKIQDATRRTLFFDEAADKMNVDPSIFTKHVINEKSKSDKEDKTLKRRHNIVETNFLSLLFNNPGTIDSIFENISPDDFDSRELSRLYSAIIQQYKDIGVIDAKALIDNSNDPTFISLISEVAAIDWDDDMVESETRSLVKQMMIEKRKRLRRKLQSELAKAEAENDQKKANQLLVEIQNLNKDA